MSKSFTWDGNDLSIYGLHVSEYSIPEMGSIRSSVHSAVFGDSLFTSTNHTTQQITIRCEVIGGSRIDLSEKMSSVLGILNPILADKPFVFPDFPDKRFIGRVVSITPPEVKGELGRVFTVEVVAMAHKQDLEEVNDSIAITSTPESFTIPAVSGNVNRIPVVLYLRNSTASPHVLSPITISNSTTNESIVVTPTVGASRSLRIGNLDSNGRYTESIGVSDGAENPPSGATYNDSIAAYTSGDWIRLKGGVDNVIIVSGFVSNGVFEWAYRGKHF